MGSVLHNNQVLAVMIGGGFFLLTAVLVRFVREAPGSVELLERVVEEEGMLPTLTPPENPAGLIVCAEIPSWAPFPAESRSLP
jgi:hypothetical protein